MNSCTAVIQKSVCERFSVAKTTHKIWDNNSEVASAWLIVSGYPIDLLLVQPDIQSMCLTIFCRPNGYITPRYGMTSEICSLPSRNFEKKSFNIYYWPTGLLCILLFVQTAKRGIVIGGIECPFVKPAKIVYIAKGARIIYGVKLLLVNVSDSEYRVPSRLSNRFFFGPSKPLALVIRPSSPKGLLWSMKSNVLLRNSPKAPGWSMASMVFLLVGALFNDEKASASSKPPNALLYRIGSNGRFSLLDTESNARRCWLPSSTVCSNERFRLFSKHKYNSEQIYKKLRFWR